MRLCRTVIGLTAVAAILLSLSPDIHAGQPERVTVVSTQSISATLSDSRRITLAGIDPMPGTGFEYRLAGLFRSLVPPGDYAISRVSPDGPVPDRHGREPVLLILTQGEPAQLPLLEAGLTRFIGFSGAGDAAIRALFLKAEAQARSAGKGLWADPRFVVFTPETAPQRDGFAVVEGVVLAVARTRSMVYLNFGADWRTDFTAAIEPRLLKTDAWADWDIDTLTGRTVRLRGWMRPYNGAFMTLISPDQIELPDGD